MKKYLSVLLLCLLTTLSFGATYYDSGNNASITVPEITVTGLTASKPVFTNASKSLTSSGTVPIDQGGTGQTTAAAAFGALKQSATESVTGVAELATVAEAVAGTDTARITTPQGVAAATAVIKNPLAFAQGVYLTVAASGSTGITTADNDNIDFGTGNFSYEIGVSLPGYTPAANVIIAQKHDGSNGWILSCLTTGYLRLTINSTNYDSTATLASAGVSDGDVINIGFFVTRSSASTAGSVVFGLNKGQLGNSVTITAGAPTTVSNAVSMYTMGTSATRSAGRVYFSIPYNRALTISEHKAFYENGIAYADKWGSSTEVITNQTDRDFSGANNWVNVNIDTFDATGDLSVSWTNINRYCKLTTGVSLVAGKKYRITVDVANLAGTANIREYEGSGVMLSLSENGTKTGEFTAMVNCTGFIVVSTNVTGSVDLDNFSIIEIGATLALESEGIQPAPGQWLDSSNNKLHAWQPATGSSLTRYKKTFEIRGTNTWAGTHEAQSVTMLTDASRAMLPANCYITDIIGVVAGTTIEDIIIGDGSDTDHWVEATTGLAAGTTSFAIANHISDGTNMEMVVDPDNNFTGSITWTIRGYILD